MPIKCRRRHTMNIPINFSPDDKTTETISVLKELVQLAGRRNELMAEEIRLTKTEIRLVDLRNELEDRIEEITLS